MTKIDRLLFNGHRKHLWEMAKLVIRDKREFLGERLKGVYVMGSFISNKDEPKDLDLVFVMKHGTGLPYFCDTITDSHRIFGDAFEDSDYNGFVEVHYIDETIVDKYFSGTKDRYGEEVLKLHDVANL